MALIDCSECGKEVSNKASSCPNCGNPINQIIEKTKIENTELLKFPDLPLNLTIGKQVGGYGGDTALPGVYNQSENTIAAIKSGEVKVFLHTHGIEIMKGLTSLAGLSIHNSQIISLKQTSQGELSKIDKSVIGRAVVGGLILGPLGAIVGGMSGIGNKEKFINKHYLVINYWDVRTKSAQTLLISSKKYFIEGFIRNHHKEKDKNKLENRQAEIEKVTIPKIIFMVVVLALAGYGIYWYLFVFEIF